MENLIKSLTLVGVLTVVVAAHSAERVVNGNFLANAADFKFGNGLMTAGSGNPTAIPGWTALNQDGNILGWNIGINGAATGLIPKDQLGPTNTGGRTYVLVASDPYGQGRLDQDITLQAGQYRLRIDVAEGRGDQPTRTARAFVTDGNRQINLCWENPTKASFATRTAVATIDESEAGTWTLHLQNDFSIGVEPVCFANVSIRDLPIIDSVTITSIAGTTLSYTGGEGSSFTLLTSTSVATPLNTWTIVASNPTTPGTFTIPAVGSGGSPVFYSIQSQ
jgi:hypothetical protein